MRRSDRAKIVALQDFPNVGKAVAADLRELGIGAPAQPKHKDPYALYAKLDRRTAVRHDPCLLDRFIAAMRFVEGGPAKPWWAYRAERKRALAMRTTRKRRSAASAR